MPFIIFLIIVVPVGVLLLTQKTPTGYFKKQLMDNKSRATAKIPTPVEKFWFTVSINASTPVVVWRESVDAAFTWRDIYAARGYVVTEVTDEPLPKPLKRR